MKVRRQWDDIDTVMKEKDCQSRILYLTNLSFKNKEELGEVGKKEIKIFPDK